MSEKNIDIDETIAKGLVIVANVIPDLIVWESIRHTSDLEQMEQKVRGEYETRFNR